VEAKSVQETHRLAQLLDERQGLPLQTPLEPIPTKNKHHIRSRQTKKKIRGNKRTTARMVPSPGPRGEELDEVVGGHVEQRVEVDAAVAVLAERPLLGRAGGDLGLNIDIRLRDTN
jgi:hypothetical protein